MVTNKKAEKDNFGCYFLGAEEELRYSEVITVNKEFCDCSFCWKIGNGATGRSAGKTLSAIPTDIKNNYTKEDFTFENAATIPCKQVLGTYVVKFKR